MMLQGVLSHQDILVIHHPKLIQANVVIITMRCKHLWFLPRLAFSF